MGTENVRILHISGDLATLQDTQIGVSSSADADLGYKMWGGRDADTILSYFLAKDQHAKINDLQLTMTTHSGTDYAKVGLAADPDTYIRFASENIRFLADNTIVCDMKKAMSVYYVNGLRAITFEPTYFYINESQQDMNFGVYNCSPGDFALFIDSKLSTIGINTSVPEASLSINGGCHVGGTSDPGDNNLYVDGTGFFGGNVGFGTTSAYGQVQIENASAGAYPNADLIIGNGNPNGDNGATTHLQIYRSAIANGYIGLDAYISGASGTSIVLNAANGGNVGIGTTTGAAKLAINGGLNVGADTDPGDNNLHVTGKIMTGGEYSPDCDIGGVTLSGTGKILTAKLGGTNHPFTDYGDADTSLVIFDNGTNGGVNVYGLNENTCVALNIGGFVTAGDATVPPLQLQFGESDGSTGIGVLESTEKGLRVLNYTTEILSLYGDGSLFIDGKISTGGEALPDCDAGGITINHGANDGFALTIKNSDVSHPFTSVCEADTYITIGKQSSTLGGGLIQGFTDATTGPPALSKNALVLTAHCGATSLDGPAMAFTSYKSDGSTGDAAIANSESAFDWNSTSLLMRLYGDGSLSVESNKRVACGGGSTGAGTTPAGTVTLEINGTSYKLLYEA